MHLLAIHEDSNANLTVFRDNEVLYAVAEERLTRVRFKAGFPRLSLERALRDLDLDLDRIDHVVCGNKYHFLPRVLGSRFPTFEHPFLGASQKASLLYQHLLYKDRHAKRLIEGSNSLLLRRFVKRRVREIVDHHEAHAYSAFLTSGFEQAVAVTTDNYGDGFSSCVFECRGNRCTRLYGSSALDSPGQFYGEIAQILGFHPLLAGKMTGLAAYGNPEPAYGIMSELLRLDEQGQDFRLPPLLLKSPGRGLLARLKAHRREDVAAAAQKRLEDVMVAYVEQACRRTGLRDLVLAGGVFANVLLNRRLLDLEGVDRIFVHPAMSDQGISMGAGLKLLTELNGLRPFELPHLYLGPGFSEAEAREELERSGLPYKRREDVVEFLAEALARGRLVGICRGPMEYGPRALGNRSILYTTTDRQARHSLNRRLRRSEFMPFAPVTLAEFADRCYLQVDKARYAARFMTMAFSCTPWMQATSPAVVHLDGTARPQLLSRQENPLYYDVLRAYHDRTGIPSLINTSYNLHEEPIVCSPREALRSMRVAGLDYVLLGDFLVRNPAAGGRD